MIQAEGTRASARVPLRPVYDSQRAVNAAKAASSAAVQVPDSPTAETIRSNAFCKAFLVFMRSDTVLERAKTRMASS